MGEDVGEDRKVPICIQWMSGEEVLATSARPFDTVRSLKRKIEATTGIPVSQQCLISGTKMLSNRWTIDQAQLPVDGLLQFVQSNLEGKSADIFVPVHTLPNGCIVLERRVEPNYKPPEDVVDEYAEHLGIDPDTEADYLWIAQECLMAPVPPPWMSCCVAEGDIFYFNSDTGLTTWEHPCEEMYRKVFQNLREVRAQAAAQKSTSAGARAVSGPSGPVPVQHGWDDIIPLSDDEDDAISVASCGVAEEEGQHTELSSPVHGRRFFAAASNGGDDVHLARLESTLPQGTLPCSRHARWRFLRKCAIEERQNEPEPVI